MKRMKQNWKNFKKYVLVPALAATAVSVSQVTAVVNAAGDTSAVTAPL